MTTIENHDDYIAEAPEQFRSELTRLRATIRGALPDAEEIVAYNMPGFTINGTIVASYAAFTKQCGLYLLPAAITELAEEIAVAGLKATKTGITFTLRKPIPDELITKLVLASGASVGA